MELIAILAWPLCLVFCTVVLRRAVRAGIDEALKRRI
jgi:hypothetical protein